MPINSSKIWTLAEGYLSETLSGEEKKFLDDRLSIDALFQTEFQECVNMLRSLQGNARQAHFRSMLQDIHRDQVPAKKDVARESRTISLKNHYWRTAGIAAGIAIITSLSTYWAIRHMNGRIESQYSLLRRDLEKYKRSQNQLINNIKSQNAIVPAPAQYGGTGFALTNNGYLVTNYHVTEGADSIYIQNHEGLYFRASLIGFDQKTDIAVLKVDDEDFRFHKGELPYTFAASKKKLGARIFTLGFPQEEIVYNEGYIASVNGYNGDSLQYRLELPASPGQSGAPIVDASGNIIGLVTGKERQTEGTTYAVSSEALLELLPDLIGHDLQLPKVNRMDKLSREQQIEKLRQYTCSVKVYKQ